MRNFNLASSSTNTNFRRTNSLRSPRKLVLLPCRPLFLSSHSYRPAVQRGLSDEGPISTSYLKTEEYDEMPVRSVCQNDFAIKNTAMRMTKKENNSSCRRGFSASSKHNIGLDSKRDSVSPETTSDEAAPFIVEKESKPNSFEISISAKDLKDKSNALSKQNSLSLESPSMYKNINNLYSVRLEPIELLPNDICSQNTPTTSLSRPEELEIIDFVDPKLINIYNKLSIDATKLFDTDDSTRTIKKTSIDTSNFGNRSLADGKNLRKRKILLDRNNFLFDAMPEVINISFESTDKILDLPKTPQLDDFDVHELFSSFGSDEKDLPIFKNCQEFLSSHLNQNKLLKSNSNCFVSCSNDQINIAKEEKEDKLDCDFKFSHEEKEKGEIFICIETDQNENDFDHPAKDDPLADNPTTQFLDIVDNNFSKIEDVDEQVKRNNIKNLEVDGYHSVHDVNIQEKTSSYTAYKRYPIIFVCTN